MAVYQLTEEGNPTNGVCYRLYELIPVDGERVKVVLDNLNGIVGWDSLSDVRDRILSLAAINDLRRASLINGDGLGECKLPLKDFNSLRESLPF